MNTELALQCTGMKFRLIEVDNSDFNNEAQSVQLKAKPTIT